MTLAADRLRNIVLAGHSGAGKTSLAEAILFNAGVLSRIGKVEDGNTAMDFEPEELKRNSSISTGFFGYEWKKCLINLLDTPGDDNFFTDTKLCMQAAENAAIVVDAVDGLRFQTEQACNFAGDFGLSCMIVINKLDKERADFYKTYEDIKESLAPKPIILQLPIGSEAGFKGVVDLLSMQAYVYDENGTREKKDIPGDMKDKVEEERERLIENIAEADDQLLERYLEGETLSDEDIIAALKAGILKRVFSPVLCASSTKNIGVDLVSDFVVDCMVSIVDKEPRTALDESGKNEVVCKPDPDEPFAAFVFKTVADPYAGRLSIFKVVSGSLGADGGFYNTSKRAKERYTQLLNIAGKEQKAAQGGVPGSIVAVAKLKETTTGDTLCDDKRKVKFDFTSPMPTLISFAVQSKVKGEEDKIFSSLARLIEEDPGLKLERNSETREILLGGRGQVHIEVVVEKLKRKFNIEVLLNKPKVPYRETIKKKVRAQGKYKKQTGGHGQYGDCWIQLEPLPKGSGFEFVDAIVGGVIPKTYIPAVEKGIVEAASKGFLSVFPCVDFKAIVDDGSYHSVDSSEMAFKVAGSMAFKKAMEDASPVLLEPIMNISVITPDEFMGDIMGDMNSRRGRVQGMDSEGKYQIIKAQVPMAEILTYAPDLRSMTQGKGSYSMEFSHYEEVPGQIAEKIIAEEKKNIEEK